MRRVLMIAGAAAAMAAFSTQAMAAHTQAEIHMFFGSGLVDGVGTIPAAPTAAEMTSNPDLAVAPGHFVVFPIWLRMMPGDFAAGALTSVGFRVFDSGNTASVANGGNTNNFLWTPGGAAVGGGVGSGATNATIDPSLTLKHFRSGYFNVKAATDGNVGAGIYLLGTMRVNVLPSAQPTDVINFWIASSGDVAGQDTISTGTTSNGTMAFGARSDGTPDTYRRTNTNLDVLGANQASGTADASIRTIPEPTTIALLGLGLLAARRRKLA